MILRGVLSMSMNTKNEAEDMGLRPKEEFIRDVYFGDRSCEENIADVDSDEFLDMLREKLKDYDVIAPLEKAREEGA